MSFAVIGERRFKHTAAIVENRIEEDVVDRVMITTFSFGVVSFLTMLEIAGTTPVQNTSESGSMASS